MTTETIKCPCCGQQAPRKNEVEVDLFDNTVRYQGSHIVLTGRLAKLASILARRMPEFLPHESITTKMWGDAEIDVDGNLKVAVAHLRARLKRIGLTINNSWGRGYAMAPLPEMSRTERFNTTEVARAQA